MTSDSLLAAAGPSTAETRRPVLLLYLVKGFGAVVLFITLTPLFRWLDRDVTGQAGRAAFEQATGYYDLMWSGLLLVAPIAVAAGFFTRSFDLAAVFSRAAVAIQQPSSHRWAILLALSTFVLASVFTTVVMHGRPYHIDAIAQLLHARFWAEGALAGPIVNGAFWTVQNALFTPNGWVSQYPPGHVAILAVAAAANAAWIAGPLLAAILVYASARTADQLLRDEPAAARLGSALLALSPFVVFLSGSFMNHITAATFLALSGFLLTRETATRPAWLGAGAALGVAFATRPLTALAMGAVYVFATPFVADAEAAGQRLRRSIPWVLIGAAVPAFALLTYNAHFFGSPFTLGYDIALGTAGGLGFGIDPWGNRYDAAAALGYTAMDVLALGTHLLESPLSPLLLIAVALLTMRNHSRGVALLIGIASVVLAANFFYWHHGLYMGPRMLFEAAPAWLLLFAVSVVQVARRFPAASADARFSARNAFIVTATSSVLLGMLVFAPQRARGYASPATASVAEAAVQAPAIVFVHENWRSRLAMRLAATGMRLDSIETALRQNTTCDVHHYADAREVNPVHAGGLASALSFQSRAINLPPVVEVAPGVRVVGDIASISAGACAGELRSDLVGVQDLASLLAAGDLPTSPARGILYVRDFGPERNRELLSRHGDRAAYTMTTDSTGQPKLLPYEVGIQLMWRDSSALTRGS